MDTDKVIQDLNRRFAAPLPEFYRCRIIFWYDEDKEFKDKLDEVVLENTKVIALTGNNTFSVKKLLSVDDLADGQSTASTYRDKVLIPLFFLSVIFAGYRHDREAGTSYADCPLLDCTGKTGGQQSGNSGRYYN